MKVENSIEYFFRLKVENSIEYFFTYFKFFSSLAIDRQLWIWIAKFTHMFVYRRTYFFAVCWTSAVSYCMVGREIAGLKKTGSCRLDFVPDICDFPNLAYHFCIRCSPKFIAHFVGFGYVFDLIPKSSPNSFSVTRW